MKSSKQLREELWALIQRGRDVIDDAEKAGRDLTAEERARIEGIHATARTQHSRIQAAERQEEMEAALVLERRLPAGTLIPRDAVRDPIHPGENTMIGLPLDGRDPTARQQEQRANRIFDAWARFAMGLPVQPHEQHGLEAAGFSPTAGEIELTLPSHDALSGPALAGFRAGLPVEAYNALTTGGSTSGGYLVPRGFVATLEVAMLQTAGMLQASTVMRTGTGEELPIPTTDDTAQEGELLPEEAQTGEQDVGFGSLRLRSYEYSSKIVRVQNQLVRDAGVDVGAVVARLLGERLGRILNRHCTEGDGAAKAKGIVPAATLGVTAASQTALGADEIINLIHSIDAAYRTAGCGFMMHDSIFMQLSLLKDGNGNYLMTPGLADGTRPTIRNWPVIPNNHMDDTLAAANKVVLFGQLKKYIVRQVAKIRVQRLVERYADYNQTGFLAFSGADGGLLDAGTHPVKYLQMKA